MYDIGKLAQEALPTKVFTDSLSIFEILTKATITSKKRLIIDVQCVRHAYQRKEVQHDLFIRSQYSPADVLTKDKTASFLLGTIISSKLMHLTEQWTEKAA